MAFYKWIDEIVCGREASDQDVFRRTRALQRHSGESPLSRALAQRLASDARERILIVTGFVVPELFPAGENDGPLGTVALARALSRLGHQPVLLVDPPLVDTVRWLSAEIGFRSDVHPLVSEAYPSWIERVDKAIAIEKPGANSRGFLHTFDGRRIVGGSVPVDRLFRGLTEAGRWTLGIGDRGNEIGFGSLRDEVCRLHPTGGMCSCGCEAGVVCVTETTCVYPCAVSNWGAYGVAAALALHTGRMDLLLLPEEERRMLRVAAVRGCRDGVARRGLYGVDGLHGEDSVRVVASLVETVEAALS